MEKSVKRSRRSATKPPPLAFVMSPEEFARLGDGKVAYIRRMSSDEARRMFPAVEGLPSGINIYALHGADGTPIALTDSQQAALGHAMGDELEVRAIH
jgi:hypothetical protein